MSEEMDVTKSLNNASKEKLIEYVLRQRDQISTYKAEAEEHAREKISIADAFLSAQTSATAIRVQAEKEANSIVSDATARAEREVKILEDKWNELRGDVERYHRYATDVFSEVSKIITQYSAMLEQDK